MTTESINIIVRERGARVVRRRLENIGDTAQRATRGLRLLQNALFVVGAAGLVSGFSRLLDTLTNFENRLRLVTTSTAQFNAVQTELFNIANRTRGEFEATAQIFTRTALAVEGMGVSIRDTLRFTESLNKAVILSGANIREANAAVIQLAQGMASGRLSGDELRSVLEQLPFAADIIAEGLDTYRGALREMGRDGKITTLDIINAFEQATDRIDELFAQTTPTVGQSLQVVRTELLRVLDRFDDVTGASAGVAKAIIALANSIEFLIAGVVAASTAFGTFQLTKFIGSIGAAIAANRQLKAAVASGNAVMLTSVGVENAKAASQLKSAEATRLSAAAKAWDARASVTQLERQRALLIQQKAMFTLDSRRKMARDALSGTFVKYSAALEHNVRTNAALMKTERMLTAARGQLTSATAARTASENALTAAQTRSAAAAAASSTWSARLTAMFPATAAALASVAAGFSFLWGIILANPIGALIAVLAAAVTALALFADKISVSSDGVVKLQDVAVASFQLIGESVAPMVDVVSAGFSTMYANISSVFDGIFSYIMDTLGQILTGMKWMINFSIGLWVGAVNSVIRAWEILPDALKDIGILAMNAIVEVMETGLKNLAELVGGFIEGIGEGWEFFTGTNPYAGMAESMASEVNISHLKQETSGALRKVGEIAQEEFSSALSADHIGNAWGAVMERARQIANERVANLDETGTPRILPGEEGAGAGGAGGGAKGRAGAKEGKTFEDILRELKLENALLRENADRRERLKAILDIERELKRSLSVTERERVDNLLKENQLLSAAATLYEEINRPATDYKRTLEALNELMESNRISADQYKEALIQARIAFLETQTTANAGMERGLLKLLERTGDTATQVEDIITRTYDGMSQALTDLVVDGKANFADLMKSIQREIVKLLISKAFNRLLSAFGDNILGGGATTGARLGTGGGLSGLVTSFKGLLGFERGGAFRVGGIGGPDSQLVAFRASPDERVKIETPTQQKNGGKEVVVNIFNNSAASASKTERTDSGGRSIVDIVIEEARNAVAMDIAQGGSMINRGLEGRYGLNPARGNKI